MFKKITALLLVFLLLVPTLVFAAINVGYYGTTSETKSTMWADSSLKDDNWTALTVYSCSTNWGVKWYNAGGGVSDTVTYNNTGLKAVSIPSIARGFKLFSNDGKEIFAYAGTTTNPNSRDITFNAGECYKKPDPPPTDPPKEETCDQCKILDCPGWGDFMDRLDEIIGKIPPPPDWKKVAEIFRDTILPAWKKDMQELIGKPPALPTKPKQPEITSKLPDKPTGKKPPGFDDSGFTADDIKNQAPDIAERQDPTGGFKIDNPLDKLPEDYPEVPDVPSDPAPNPPEKENTSPSDPEEQPNPTPKPPTESNNPAPGNPKDNEGTAPNPSDPNNPAPTPSDPSNPAPKPGDNGGNAPIPGDGGGKAPIPGADGSTAPIPGKDGSTAPIPGKDGSTAPIPK